MSSSTLTLTWTSGIGMSPTIGRPSDARAGAMDANALKKTAAVTTAPQSRNALKMKSIRIAPIKPPASSRTAQSPRERSFLNPADLGPHGGGFASNGRRFKAARRTVARGAARTPMRLCVRKKFGSLRGRTVVLSQFPGLSGTAFAALKCVQSPEAARTATAGRDF